MKHWHKYLIISLGLHALLIAAMLLFSREPAQIKPKQKPDTIKSYLVIQSLPAEQTLEPPPVVVETTEPEPELTIDLTESTEPQTSEVLVTPKPNEAAEVLPNDEPAAEAELEKRPSELTVQADGSQATASAITNAVKNYLSSESSSVGSWQSHQQQQFLQRYQRSLEAEPKDLTGQTQFAHKGTGIDHVATSADGSQLVKHQGTCYSVGRDQWGDNLWTPTPCPNSADKNSQLLQQSLQKYGLLKNK